MSNEPIECARCKTSHYQNDAMLIAPGVWICRGCGELLFEELETRYAKMEEEGRFEKPQN